MGLYFAHQTLDNTQDELVALNRCLAIQPQDANLYFFRGVTLFKLQKYKAALLDLDRHAEQQNRAAQTQYWRGRCNIMLEQWQEADSALTRAIELDKAYLDRLSWRALCRAKIPSRALDAAKDADQVLKSESSAGGDLWRCARVFALCAGSKEIDKKLSEEYASRSIKLLRQALTVEHHTCSTAVRRSASLTKQPRIPSS